MITYLLTTSAEPLGATLRAAFSVEWMLASAVVTGLLAAAAIVLERVVMLRRGLPTRWIWPLAATMALVVSVRWMTLAPPIALMTQLPVVEVTTPTSTKFIPVSDISIPQPQASAWTLSEARIRASLAWPEVGATTQRLVIRMWGVASTFLVLLMVWSNVRFYRQRQTWRTTTMHSTRVRISDGFGPAIAGLLRTEIVIPPWVLALDDAAQHAILAHEEEHRIARDPLLLIASLLPLIAMPWNVGLFIMRRRLVRAIETDCDQRVLARGVVDTEYANVLLGAWQHARGNAPLIPSPALAEHVSGLGRRVEHLMRPTPRRRLMKTVTGVLGASLMIAMTFLLPVPPQAQSAPKTPPAPSKTMVAQPALPAITALPLAPQLPPAPPEALASTTATPPAPPITTATPLAPQLPPGPPVQRAASRILIMAPLDTLGSRVANAVQAQLAEVSGVRPLYIIPYSEFDGYMRAAGFDASTPITARDVRAISQLTRADLVMTLEVLPTEDGVRVIAGVGIGNAFAIRRIAESTGSVDVVSERLTTQLRAAEEFRTLRQP